MEPRIEEALRCARTAREQGEGTAALQFYMLAAGLARDLAASKPLAHALRHISDVARDLGVGTLALEAAAEAVMLYRADGGAPLDLANALRLQALATARRDEATHALWNEARALYAEAEVAAGVAECDAYLSQG